MKNAPLFLSLLVIAAVSGCRTPVKLDSPDARFESLARNFIDRMLERSPEDATVLGDHRFDAQFSDESKEGIAQGVQLRKAYLDSLGSIRIEDLSQMNRVDYDILRHNLEADIFASEQLRPWENDPLHYNIGGAIFSLLARNFAPLPDRMKSLAGRLSAIPEFLEHAKANLKNPPAVHVEAAIQQNEGNLSLLQETLTPFLDSIPAELREEIVPLRDAAVGALKEYGSWLRIDLLPRAKGNFRLGTDLYDRKLAYTIDTDMRRGEILQYAEEDIQKTTNELYDVCVHLWTKYFPNKPVPQNDEKNRGIVIGTVLKRLSDDRPDNTTILDVVRRDLDEATEFVRRNDLVSIPSNPLDVIMMPEFQRGVAVAYCDSPGPLEKNGKTFIALSLTPKDWPVERVQSFFREYNAYMLKDLTVHEAMPGHFLQLMTGNRFKAPTMVRAIYASGTFAEGWATYAEQVMAEAGYGGLEFHAEQLKLHLRLVINAIIDQKIHTAGLTEKEAMELMMNKGFQEEGEAMGKWRRACLTSVQLSTYFIGYIMFTNLRSRYERYVGPAFDAKLFHDKILSFGTLSPRYLPTLMQLPVPKTAQSGF